MKITVEDEAEGDTWSGYVSVELVDDSGDLVVDANIAPEWIPDLDTFLEALEALGLRSTGDSSGPTDVSIGEGGPGWPEDGF